MDPFLSFKIAASGLMIQRLRMNIIASNIANAETTRTTNGGPYRRKDLFVTSVPVAKNIYAVAPVSIINDPRPFRVVYEPGHPDADENGYVKLPNVSSIEEMINMISAVRAYEANIAVINNTKTIISRTLEIAR
ncbi:MAG: flagellar basal body rod protein FlgC [Deltaproteobacteria bacterium]|nr:MAG: flagellar basal body rod protein FlgC [Deltaproteobacteria bacterium]